MRLEERGTTRALERMMPGEQFVRDDAPGVEIDAMIDRRIGGELLRRHIRRSADAIPVPVRNPLASPWVVAADNARATPKSVTSAAPDDSNTFSGLMSR